MSNTHVIEVEGRQISTLRDILPPTPGLKILFVAKTPAPISVEAGHYFQGKQGRMVLNRLKEYGLFMPTTKYEDDSILAHGYGLTDIIKVPHSYGNEPSDKEYRRGSVRILQLIKEHRPSVVVFVYKAVLDQILKFHFSIRHKSTYGFNTTLDCKFGTRVFAFPLPGTPCKSADAHTAMKELAETFT